MSMRTHPCPKHITSLVAAAGTIRQGGLVMRQREWVTSTLDDCPVPEEVIGLLYRSSHNRVYELISGLSAPHRASLATFCYGRAHLRIRCVGGGRRQSWQFLVRAISRAAGRAKISIYFKSNQSQSGSGQLWRV